MSLFYERRLHTEPSDLWVAPCRLQIGSVLDALEAEAEGPGPFRGATMGHDDIALACALRFIREAHPAVFDPGLRPRLAARAAGTEALAVFRAIAQPFMPPA